MRKILYLTLNCTIFLFCACSSDSDDIQETDNNSVTVEITTDIQTRAVVTTLFTDGAEMSVYAKTYNKPDAPDFVSNVKGTYHGGKWTMNPSIQLKEGERAFVYALSPYAANLTDLSNIPIDISEQQDVLYSGSSVPVSHTTYQAKLTMKHALSLVTLNISQQGYTGKSVLQTISLTGEKVYTSGTMNIETGKIAGNGKKDVAVSVEKQIDVGGWTEELPRMWAIPFSTKVETAMLKAKIDGKDFEAKFPEIEMKSGYQYIFHLVLTNYGLEFIPDQTQSISLNQETDQMGELKGYGILQLTHNGNEFVLPVLTGDNVFGSVAWGDNSTTSYTIDGVHHYSVGGEKQIIIESWNSTGFKLNNLVGIKGIDITQY